MTTAGRITAPRIAIGSVLLGLFGVIAWSCAGELDNIDEYRLGASTLRSCFGDENPPKFLTSSRCKQCHLSKDNGIGAALDLTSPNMGERFSKLVGSCPEELLVDPANPEASTLYKYVNDEIDSCTYHKMPPTGAGLSAADRRCLLTWIDGLDDVDDLGDLDDGGPADDGEGGGDGAGDGDSAPGDQDDGPAAPTLTQIRNQIFNVSCAGCHQGGSAPRGLVLGPNLPIATLHANIVNVAADQSNLDYIEPNNPQASFLYRKLLGTQGTADGCTTGTCGERMPRGQAALGSSLLNLVEGWINDGAPEN